MQALDLSIADIDLLANAVIGRICEQIYPLPDLEHEQGWFSYLHSDIAAMPDAILADHRARLRLRLILRPEGDQWFASRLFLIESEREKRKKAS